MTTRWSYDEPKGIIVGDITIPWQLFYDGKPKGERGSANSEEEAIEAARKLCAELKAEYCGYPYYFYPDGSKWEVRVYVS